MRKLLILAAVVCGAALPAHAGDVNLWNSSQSAVVQVYIVTQPSSCSNVSWTGRLEAGDKLTLSIGTACLLTSYRLWSYGDPKGISVAVPSRQQFSWNGVFNFEYRGPGNLVFMP